MNLANMPKINEIVCANTAGKPAGSKHQKCLTWPDGIIYLDSCATYHSVFVEWILKNTHKVDTYLTGHGNVGLLTYKEKGYRGLF